MIDELKILQSERAVTPKAKIKPFSSESLNLFIAFAVAFVLTKTIREVVKK